MPPGAPQRLAGKVAVVTGAGRGIGRSCAKLFAREGASVLVNDLGCGSDGEGRSETPAREVVEEITQAGGRALACFESVAERGNAETILDRAIDTFGGLDVLVNMAGITRDRSVFKLLDEDLDLVLETILGGSFR